MQLKDEYKDTVLIFKMDSGYETFFGDAETASRILGIPVRMTNHAGGQVRTCVIENTNLDFVIRELMNAGWKIGIWKRPEDE